MRARPRLARSLRVLLFFALHTNAQSAQETSNADRATFGHNALEETGNNRLATRSDCGTAVLWWIEHRTNCRCLKSFARHGDARLDFRPRLVAQRDDGELGKESYRSKELCPIHIGKI